MTIYTEDLSMTTTHAAQHGAVLPLTASDLPATHHPHLCVPGTHLMHLLSEAAHLHAAAAMQCHACKSRITE